MIQQAFEYEKEHFPLRLD
jgi:hypothetical protein